MEVATKKATVATMGVVVGATMGVGSLAGKIRKEYAQARKEIMAKDKDVAKEVTVAEDGFYECIRKAHIDADAQGLRGQERRQFLEERVTKTAYELGLQSANPSAK